MTDQDSATGLWLVGARGSVAVAATVGAAALKAGLCEPTGCVTALAPFAGAGLPACGSLVFGGHDVGDVSLTKKAEQLAAGGVLPAAILPLVAEDLRAAEARIRPGVPMFGDRRTQRAQIHELAADIERFQTDHGLARVVVVHVASTEAPFPGRPEHATLAGLDAALDRGEAVLPPSSLYAYAAMRAGCAYADFTPSTGARLPALDELARTVGVPYAGSDGKTGETLLVSALAPMFAARALKVTSWSGTNLLGGGDGATLAASGPARSKTASKRRGLTALLGPVDGVTHIDDVPALGEWKTAWDHIGFEGFLGTRMTMQTTWQGCDSALAAPLVLDLARLLARAHEAGVTGAFGPAGFFFKDPLPMGGGAVEYGLWTQFETLTAWAATVSAVSAEPEGSAWSAAPPSTNATAASDD